MDRINKYFELCKFSELPPNFPDWLKENPEIKKAPNNFTKNFPIEDFKKPIDSNFYKANVPVYFAKNIKNVLVDIFYVFDSFYLPDDFNQKLSKKLLKFKLFLDSVRNSFDVNDESKILELLNSGYVNIGNQKFKFFKFLNMMIEGIYENKFTLLRQFGNFSQHIIDKNESYFNGIPERLEDIQGFGSYSNKHKLDKVYIVLSTKPEDILRMSSSSDWTSCQNMEDGVYNECIVSTALYNNIAICYLTNEEQTKYGEKMIARTILRVIFNEDSGKEAILMSKVYPDDGDEKNIIFNELNKYGITIYKNLPEGNWVSKLDKEDIEDYKYNSYEEPPIQKSELYKEINLDFDVDGIKKILQSNHDFYYFDRFDNYLKKNKYKDIYDYLFILSAHSYIDEDTKNKFIKRYKDWKIGHEYDLNN